MTRLRTCRGFTLIELMVSLAIAVILLVLATPAYVSWMADAEVQSGASSVADGIRSAQAEAVKRNGIVEFVLDPTSGSGGWQVQLQGTTIAINQGNFASGSYRSSVTATPTGATIVTFGPLGQIWTDDGTPTGKNLDGSDPITQVSVANTSSSRPLTVLFGGAGAGVKLCDPAFNGLTPPDPKGCY